MSKALIRPQGPPRDLAERPEVESLDDARALARVRRRFMRCYDQGTGIDHEIGADGGDVIDVEPEASTVRALTEDEKALAAMTGCRFIMDGS